MSQDISRVHRQPVSDRSVGKPSLQVKEHGFTLLSEGTSPEADVFFIHGLQGHPKNTWTYPEPQGKDKAAQDNTREGFGKKIGAAFRRQHKESMQPAVDKAVFWPSDLLPQDFANIRIFTYGYDSHVTHLFKGPAIQLDIFSYGESLLNGLEARRRDFPERPLIFIVHSLGGLILKDALRRSRSSNEQRFRAIQLATNAIFFLGTPHRGGSYVNLGLTARKILACSGFDASDKVLRDLKFDSSTAKLLSEEFSKILDETRPSVYTFQEATGLSGFGPLSGKVVEDFSSALDYARQEKDIIYANHINMCRFSGFDDDGYEKIKAALSHCLSMDFHPRTEDSERGIHQRILRSLYLPDSQERFDQVEDAYEGTFGWLFEKKELGFVKWLQSGSGIFWISGKPASGKSTLLKYAVSDPRTRELLRGNNPGNRWICGDFFFTNRGKHTQKNIEGLLQRILYQLLIQAEGLVGFIDRIFKEHADIQGEWMLIYLEDALMKIVEQRKFRINICLFIDALDEHDEGYHENHFRLVHLLQKLTQKSDGKVVKVMLCLTSRPENVFQEGFHGCPGFPIQEHTHIDINTYVTSRMERYLQSRPDLSCNVQIMEVLNETFKEVIRRAQGVFLWVKLVIADFIEGLMDGDSPYSLQENLIAIPGDGDLQELYGGILLRLRPNYLFESFFMLQIAYAATEPMPLGEFFQALDISILGNMSYNWVVSPRPEMERKLNSRCRGFLEIKYSLTTDEQGSEYHGPIVQFLHQSVKDFLRDSTSFEEIRKKLQQKFTAPQGLLSENGHAYLLRFRVREHFHRYRGNPDVIKQLDNFDLRKFDVLYQAYMVEITLQRPITQPLDTLSEFADKNGLVPIYMRHGNWRVPPSWQPNFLVLAVQAGLAMYVQYAFERRVNIRSLVGQPLLHYSVLPLPQSLSKRGTDPFLRSPKMVKLLVWLGADIECEFEEVTAFGFVFKELGENGRASRSELQMLETLLQLGSNTEALVVSTKSIPSIDSYGHPINFMKEDWVTPLQLAVQRDDLEVVKLLLQFNARIEALSEDDWKFLRKGYMYSDEAPEFENDRPFETDQEETREEKLGKWLAKRERAIREGKNTKPMLRLIEEHQSRRLLTVPPASRRPVSAQYTYPNFALAPQSNFNENCSDRASSHHLYPRIAYPTSQDSFRNEVTNFYPPLRQDSFQITSPPLRDVLRTHRSSSMSRNYMLSTPQDADGIHRSASEGHAVAGARNTLSPMTTPNFRPEQNELFF